MANDKSNFVVIKILLALLPTILFWQNYAWMSLNAYLGIAFLVIWALMIWNTWQFTDKNYIFERYFRLTEIGFFLLPLSAIIFSFVFGSQTISSTTNEFEQAGAAIGAAIGGSVVVVLAFMIGIIGGIIMHLVSGRYEKKAEESKTKQPESLPTKHGVILSLVSIFLLAIIVGVASGSAQQPNEVTNQKVTTTEETNQKQEVSNVPKNSRTNPAGLNEPYVISIDDIFLGKASYEIELVEITSGDTAWSLVKKANQFNDAPKENEEYVLAKFRVKILETENDKPYTVDNFQFKAVSKNGVTYDSFVTVAGLEPKLSKELYAGAEHIGYTFFIVNKDDSPVVSHLKGSPAELWFNLRAQ